MRRSNNRAWRTKCWCGTSLAVWGLLLGAANAWGQIEPNTNGGVLEYKGQSLRPTRITAPWREEHLVGEHRLIFDANSITALDDRTGKQLWSTKTQDGRGVRWLTAEHDILYVRTFPLRSQERKKPVENSPLIHRLALRTGQWLEDLPITQSVGGVLAGRGLVFVLTVAMPKGRLPRSQWTPSYAITCFREGEVKPQWTYMSPAAGDFREEDNVLRFSVNSAIGSEAFFSPLVWLGEDVLVCAGGDQDILCFNANTGEVRWRLARVWEFQRGLTGPSSSHHYLSRFGIYEFESGLEISKQKKAVYEKARKKFDQQYKCYLIAGPIIVPYRETWADKSVPRIFVALAKHSLASEQVEDPELPGDCLVYELDERGQPISRVTLPRCVISKEYQVVRDGLVWGCDRNAVVKLTLSNYSALSLTGAECITTVDWYREFHSPRPKGWLTNSESGVKFGEYAAFTPDTIFRVHAGGYIVDKEEQVYRFPISIIETQTGNENAMLLRVPFSGTLPSDSGDEKGYQHYWPYLMAITGLQVEGRSLKVILSTDKHEAVCFDFDIRALNKGIDHP